MTLSKTALTVTSVAMALLFGGGVYLMMNINMLAKNYIERAARQTLGVDVSIGQLDIQLQNRKAGVKDLVIGNPEGFDKPYAAKVAAINIALGDVTKQLVNFKDIDVVNPEINLEVHNNITNLSAIKNGMKVSEAKGGEQLKVIIDKLTVSQAQLKPGIVLFTKEDLPPVLVPDIILKEVGRKENGILVNEAIAQVWAGIAHKLDTQALQSGLLEGMSPEALQNMGLGFGQRFKENLQENVQEKIDNLNKNINQIFND